MHGIFLLGRRTKYVCPHRQDSVFVKLGEKSLRAFDLTETIIAMNSASYSAWLWRREYDFSNYIHRLNFRCLKFLDDRSLDQSEMDFVGMIHRTETHLCFLDGWCKRNPKNYQVWFHRRWLVDRMYECNPNTRDELLQNELAAVADHLSLESKNCNAWSHRLFLANRFALLQCDSEIVFTSKHIDLDVRNNSAWSYRRHMVGGRISLFDSELEYCLEKIALAPGNESPWVYMRSIPGWNTNPSVQDFCERMVNSSSRISGSLLQRRDCAETLIAVYKDRGDSTAARSLLDRLHSADHIRSPYFGYLLNAS